MEVCSLCPSLPELWSSHKAGKWPKHLPCPCNRNTQLIPNHSIHRLDTKLYKWHGLARKWQIVPIEMVDTRIDPKGVHPITESTFLSGLTWYRKKKKNRLNYNNESNTDPLYMTFWTECIRMQGRYFKLYHMTLNVFWLKFSRPILK